MLSLYKSENELIIENLHYLFILHGRRPNDVNILIRQYLLKLFKNKRSSTYIFSLKLFHNEIQNVVYILTYYYDCI